MKKITAIHFFLLYFITQAINPSAAFSECSCLPLSNVSDSLNNSSYVMLADILEKSRVAIPAVSPNYKELKVKIRVQRYWKGTAKRLMTIRVPENAADCAINLETGKTYLIYALGGEIPLVTRCSRTKLANTPQAQSDITRLGKNYTTAED